MDDAKIIDLYWNRDESAIPATAEKYGKLCTSIAMNILASKEDAEECVNDTYLCAWNSIPPSRPSILSAFLGKITKNLSFNRYKYNTADKRGQGQMPLVLDELSDMICGSNEVEGMLDTKELADAIDAFLDKLSPKKKCIFVSRYWYTESVSDIALRCAMKEGAVSMTLNRLRKKLKCYLLERGFDL